MRHGLVLGWVAATAAAGFAQSPQPIAAPPAAPTPPAVAAEPPSSAHPWYVKPDSGAWMLMIKAYSGIDSRGMAERLAQDLRETYKVPTYLFEKGADERKKEQERVAKEVVRQRAAQQQEFLALTERLRAEAMAKNMDFLESPLRLRVPTVRYQEQWVVMVGGWPTMDAARKELDKVRRWPAPKDTQLLDVSTVLQESGGQRGYLNPFHTAMVVRNPAAPRTLDADAQSDPLVLKMNAAEDLSVLKIQKPWTIVVKSFFVPLNELRDKDAQGSVLKRMFAPRQDVLAATAGQAREMAVMLRKLPKPYEAYVLHTLNGSLVCVGQFAAADAPDLVAEQRRLETQIFEVDWIKDRRVKLFDQLVAMRVK